MAPHLSRWNAEAYAKPALARARGHDVQPIHNEAAFHHLLGIELRRLDRARPVAFLLLVRPRPETGWNPMPPAIASVVFSVLREAVRDVDLIGWYRADRVAAATLVQQTMPHEDVRPRIAERVRRILSRHLVDADRLRVRVVTLRARDDS